MLQFTLFSVTNHCLHSTSPLYFNRIQNLEVKVILQKQNYFLLKWDKKNWRNSTICKALIPEESEPKFQSPASIHTKTRHRWHCACNPLLGTKSLENPWLFPTNNPAEPMYHRFKDRPSLKKCDGKQLRNTTNADLWIPHAYNIPITVCTILLNTYAHIQMKEEMMKRREGRMSISNLRRKWKQRFYFR